MSEEVPTINDYMLIAEAAAFLGITTHTLRRWDKEKKIKVYRNPISRFRLFKKSDLIAIMNEINSSSKD